MAIGIRRTAIDQVFPLWVIFARIPHSSTIKVPIYRCFRGVGRFFRAPLLAPQHAPPYAPQAIASLFKAEYARTFYLCKQTPCVAIDYVNPSHIRGHGVPYDMKSPGLIRGRGTLLCFDCQLETVLHQTSLTAKRLFPKPCKKSRSCLRSARVK